MDKLKNFTDKVKFRAVPNVSCPAYLPKGNAMGGNWIRPQDIKYYDSISVLEFEEVTLKQEETYFNLYSQEKEWPGNLSHLFIRFNEDVDNRGLL